MGVRHGLAIKTVIDDSGLMKNVPDLFEVICSPLLVAVKAVFGLYFLHSNKGPLVCSVIVVFAFPFYSTGLEEI